MNRPVRHSLALLLIVALLAGCGWHLRGSGGGGSGGGGDLGGVKIYLRSEMGEGELATATVNALRSYGAQVVSDRQAADWVLVLLEQQTARRTVSVTRQGNASGYQLTYTLRFRVDSGKGKALLSEQTIAPEVTFQASPQNILGRESREQRLTEQLRGQALDLLIGRLADIPRS